MALAGVARDNVWSLLTLLGSTSLLRSDGGSEARIVVLSSLDRASVSVVLLEEALVAHVAVKGDVSTISAAVGTLNTYAAPRDGFPSLPLMPQAVARALKSSYGDVSYGCSVVEEEALVGKHTLPMPPCLMQAIRNFTSSVALSVVLLPDILMVLLRFRCTGIVVICSREEVALFAVEWRLLW